MKKLDILIVHPNASTEIYQDLAKEHSAIEPPIWAAMLAQHARLKGYGVQILDAEAEHLNYLETAMVARDIDPRIVCVVVYGQQPSASSQNMEGAIALVNELKKISPSIKTLLIGGHVAALPLETLVYDSVDFIAMNEGVYTLSTLLQVSDLDNPNYLEKVPGLGWKDNGLPKLNTPSPIVPQSQLDYELPGMAWDLLPSPDKYRTSGWHSWSNGSVKTPFASLYTTLGCSFKCSFCMINIINRTDPSPGVAADKSAIFRSWSVDHVMNQFDKITKAGIKNVKVSDELFVLKEHHFLEICNRLIERNYGLNLWAYSRVDTVKPNHLPILKKAGFNWLGIGIESPNQVVRKDVIKGGYKEVKIMDLLNSMKNEGINVGANYIFGLPEDTKETMQETLDFAIEANTALANLYCAMCYPGSPLYYTAKQNNWKLPDRYSGYSQHSYYTQNLPSKYLSSAEILKFRDEAWMKYHTSEKYLTMMKDSFGQAAVDNVQATTKIKLKRRQLGD